MSAKIPQCGNAARNVSASDAILLLQTETMPVLAGAKIASYIARWPRGDCELVRDYFERKSSMPTAPSLILGVDSLVASSREALANATSTSYLGQTPAFWGRYLYAPGQINSSGHRDSHYSAAENGFLRSNGIRVLPIARQTTRVATDSATGSTDARHNVDAIFEVFPPAYLAGSDPNVLVFLDVEPEDPLDPDYYAGWSSTIMSYSSQLTNGTVKLKPAIYASTRDDQTWRGLARALSGGSSCFGAYVARYYYQDPKPDHGWQPSILSPSGGVTPPILAWQYWESPDGAPADENFDTNIASPFHSDSFLDGLVMPPPMGDELEEIPVAAVATPQSV
jgi:hypothetical protein